MPSMEEWEAYARGENPGYAAALGTAAYGPDWEASIGSSEGWQQGRRYLSESEARRTGIPWLATWSWKDAGGRPEIRPTGEVAERLAAQGRLKGWPGYAPKTTAREFTPDYWKQMLREASLTEASAGREGQLPPGIESWMAPEDAARIAEGRAALASYMRDAVVPRGVNVPAPQLRGQYDSWATMKADLADQGYWPVLERPGAPIYAGRRDPTNPSMGAAEGTRVFTVAAQDPRTGLWGNFTDIQMAPVSREQWQQVGNYPANEQEWEAGRFQFGQANYTGAPRYERSVETVWYPVHTGEALSNLSGNAPSQWGLPGGEPGLLSREPTAAHASRGSPWDSAMGAQLRKQAAIQAVAQLTPERWLAAEPKERARIRALVEESGFDFMDWLARMNTTWPQRGMAAARWPR